MTADPSPLILNCAVPLVRAQYEFKAVTRAEEGVEAAAADDDADAAGLANDEEDTRWMLAAETHDDSIIDITARAAMHGGLGFMVCY